MKFSISLQTALLCLALVLCFSNSFAQLSIPIQPFAKKVEERTLVVRLAGISEKSRKKKSAEELAEMERDNEIHNEKLKKWIPKYWTLNQRIEFKTREEVDEIVKEGNEDYVVLAPKWGKETNLGSHVYYTYEAYALLLFLPEKGKKVLKHYQFDDNDNGGSSFLKRGQYLAKVSKTDYFINERDVRFACKQFEDLIHQGMSDGYGGTISKWSYKFYEIPEAVTERLKTKTLLFPKELLAVDEEAIKSTYDGPYEIVPYANIDSVLFGPDAKKYAYYTVIWSEKFRYWTMAIVDNEDCSILRYNPTMDGGFKIIFGAAVLPNVYIKFFETPNGNFVINQKHLDNLKSGEGRFSK